MANVLPNPLLLGQNSHCVLVMLGQNKGAGSFFFPDKGKECNTLHFNFSVGMAWDWLNEKLYWTDTVVGGNIEVYDINSGHRRKLFGTGPESRPRGIVLDHSTR